jgi:hypothetical protein
VRYDATDNPSGSITARAPTTRIAQSTRRMAGS